MAREPIPQQSEHTIKETEFDYNEDYNVELDEDFSSDDDDSELFFHCNDDNHKSEHLAKTRRSIEDHEEHLRLKNEIKDLFDDYEMDDIDVEH